MAGSIPISPTQQFDNLGNVLSGGQLTFIQAGTVATPQNAFQDSGLTLPWPNPYTLPANGRVPLLYFADGFIKVRVTDRLGNSIFTQDNIPVTGFSSGGGGGGTIDPTTVLQTGQLIAMYGTGNLTGFVRANGRTMGSAVSGATERGNADCQALFLYLWGTDLTGVTIPISGGRGASAAADWAANKLMGLPDFRGRAIAGLDDMGNAAAGRLTATYFGTAATVLGAAGGSQSSTLITLNLPPYSPAGVISGGTYFAPTTPVGLQSGSGSAAWQNSAYGSLGPASNPAFTGNAQGGVSAPFAAASPMLLATIYLKL